MYRVWSEIYWQGVLVSRSVSVKSYSRHGWAERAAHKMQLDDPSCKIVCIVSETNPFIEEKGD